MVGILLFGILLGIAIGSLVVWQYKDYKLIKEKNGPRRKDSSKD